MMDTLANRPHIGLGGAYGGWLGSMISTTPLFQFLSALFGTIIGLATIVGLTYRFIQWFRGNM